MGIKLSDYLNENNIKLSKSQVRTAVKEYYTEMLFDQLMEIEILINKLESISLQKNNKKYAKFDSKILNAKSQTIQKSYSTKELQKENRYNIVSVSGVAA